MKWYIPDCFWPVKDQGDYLGHEAISVLNTAEKPITAHMTLYFEDRRSWTALCWRFRRSGRSTSTQTS